MAGAMHLGKLIKPPQWFHRLTFRKRSDFDERGLFCEITFKKALETAEVTLQFSKNSWVCSLNWQDLAHLTLDKKVNVKGLSAALISPLQPWKTCRFPKYPSM